MPHLDSIETRMNTAQASLRPYLQTLVTRLVMTYGLPILLAVVVTLIFGNLLPVVLPFLPASTVSVATFCLTVLAMFYAYRGLEGRTKATSLFILYSNASRERRTLARLISQARAGTPSATDDLAKQAQTYETAVAQFQQAMTSL